MSVDLDQMAVEIKKYYNDIMETKFENGEQKYTDLNDWLTTMFPDASEHLADFSDHLKDLYGKCCSVMDVVKESRCEVYPNYPTALTHVELHLWQLGFSADMFIRGATAAYNVFRNMEADIQKGGMTSKFPVEIVPFLGSKGPGEPIAPFEIMSTIGGSVVTSAYLICFWVMEKGFFNVSLGDATEKSRLAPLANLIISVMHIKAMYEPVHDMKDAAFKSNQGKITAGQRPQPTILSYVHAYSRVAAEIQRKNKTRQTRRELVMEQVNQHNQREKVRKDKIKTDEINSLSNVLPMSAWFLRRLKIVYQFQKPQCTSVPYTLLASKFLSASAESSTKKEENPVWHGIEEWSTDKADAWLARCDGRFNYKVKEQIAKGKKPNLANQAKDFRDTGIEPVVWVMACLKVWAWPEAAKVNSAQRLKDLEEAWQRGALDETLRVHVINKRKDFKASDLSWCGSGSQDVSESSVLHEVDPLGQQQQELTEVQRASINSQFQEWAKMLQIEGGKHKLWLAEVEAFDSKRDSDIQRFRNTRALTKERAVAELCETHYSSQGFDKQDKAMTYVKSLLVKTSDIPPTKPIGSVLRLLWADLAQLGLSHSRETSHILECFKAACEHHPTVTGCILFLPNTPKSGKGLKADALREDNIKDAVTDVKNTLLTYGALAHQTGHCIIDPESMYSNDRPCTMEFSSIISSEKNTTDGEYKSLFSKGFAYRRRGVPELVKIMHRSQFVDMANKLAAASRGNLGEEKERKHWHSGRCLYKTMLKYIFQDMGLTPNARVLVQHLTAWDNEFAAAIMEQNAAKAIDMPTLTYVATGWTGNSSLVCKNLATMMSDELSNLIEKGLYVIPGYDARAEEPLTSQKRPELDDAMFKICKPRYSSKELAIMESEMTRAQTLFSIDAALKRNFTLTVEEFNKVHNPSGIPWKEVKRPRESGSQEVTAGESESRGVFLTPCSKAAKDLEAENCIVFKHAATPKFNVEFKLYVSEDGSKLYLQCSQDAVFYCPLGRFVGSFLQGQPAKTAMSGGSQWIEWKYESLESLVVACKKESSMAGTDVLPVYTHEPGTLKKFLEHLDQCGKTQYKIVSHKMERDDVGRVTGISAEDTTCLPLPTTTPSKKKFSLENIAGYVDIDAIKKSKYLQIVHNLVCPMASQAKQKHTHELEPN